MMYKGKKVTLSKGGIGWVTPLKLENLSFRRAKVIEQCTSAGHLNRSKEIG